MRGKQAPKRTIGPDPKFQNINIAKLINYMMRRGKKSTSQRVVYGAFDFISAKKKQDPIEVFNEAVKNIAPSVEVRGRRVGGANFQVPVPVRAERRFALACRWIIAAAQARKGKSMSEKLAMELLDASEKQGEAMRKKMDVYKMAEANRAFAHFSR